ncbi:alanine racemase [Notoacmeibacter sp. MSK16QG-6]|uniref:alanine racemase n=1 Tax=Notoacmeibacter sp. MSK16QG-6 TaxID=2957982 RepID=UPI0020A0037F|nr:alanine racemase [Notoacmeibacter sp. MSK16QG-6]MCP1197996.1 alanine racemase [Notoacmeibacter sp. MSK16QG-6]
MTDLEGTRLIVDRAAIRRNWETLQRYAPSSECAAVVKADAYGLGMVEIVPHLPECRTFFVATPSEGMALRPICPDAVIYVLSGPWSAAAASAMAAAKLRPVVNTTEQWSLWKETEQPFAIQVDTGMNRLGLSPSEAKQVADNCHPDLVISHLACGDEPDHPANSEQRGRFNTLRENFDMSRFSLANSAGIFLGSDYHFDLTRPGIALYGGSAGPKMRGIHRVIELKARIIQIRQARMGEHVSYGHTYRLTRDSRLAVAAIGYADGYFRSGSGSGVPLRSAVPDGAVAAMNGVSVPLVGRTTMDLSIFDITDIPPEQCTAGDWLEIIGETIALEDVARRTGTIGYEVLTALGQRHRRSYI